MPLCRAGPPAERGVVSALLGGLHFGVCGGGATGTSCVAPGMCSS